jgi:hypothetical protein
MGSSKITFGEMAFRMAFSGGYLLILVGRYPILWYSHLEATGRSEDIQPG